MSNLVVSNEGERFLLRKLLGISPVDSDDWRLHVYVNDYTPNRDTGLIDFDEAAWSGYVPADLAADDWTEPSTVAGAAVSFYSAGPVLFTPLSGTTVAYGAYVTDQTDTMLLWSFRFDAPQVVSISAPCVVPLSLSTRSESEPAPP